MTAQPQPFEWWPPEREGFQLPDELTVSEWADRYRVLDALTSAESGPWKTQRTPYLREILDAFTLEGVEQVTLMTSTQVGKTESVINTIGYTVHQDPGPGILVLPRQPDAERMLARRIRPMVEASPELMSQTTGKPRDWKTGEVRFRRSLLYLGWAESPASLAGNPCRYAWCDEADKFPVWSGREADPLDLVRERLRTFLGVRKLVVSSTPTTHEGRIAKEFDLSDRRRYHVPCPHCGMWQVLRWDRVRFNGCRDPLEMLDRNLASYHCEGCDERITDGDKLELIERGRWVAEDGEIDADGNVTEPEVANPNRGYHLWAAYSPWITWSEIAAKFLQADQSGDKAKLMNFTNSWLAELWEEKVEEPTVDKVRACIVKGYGEGELVDEVKVLTAGVDVQKRDLYVTVWGWGADERVWLVLAARLKSFDALVERVLRGRFGEMGRPVRRMCVDCRYRTSDVFALAREAPQQVRAVRGVEKEQPLPFTTSRVDRDPTTGAPYRKSLVVWHVNVGMFKDRVSEQIDVGPCDEPRALHIHREPSDELVNQLGSERKILDRTGKKVRERWVLQPGRKANHYWDTAVYAWAAAEMIHVPLLTAERVRQEEARRSRQSRAGTAKGLGANL